MKEKRKKKKKKRPLTRNQHDMLTRAVLLRRGHNSVSNYDMAEEQV
jgi:hypothetical protein